MEKYIDGSQFSDEHLRMMKNHIMFKGLDTSQIRLFLNHAQPYFLQIEEGQTIRLPAELSDYIGLVFSGHVIVYGVDYSACSTIHLKAARAAVRCFPYWTTATRWLR